MVKEAVQALATNLHIVVVSLLITALGLGVVGKTAPSKGASEQKWRIMTMTGQAPTEPLPQEHTIPLTWPEPQVPWELGSRL